MKTFFLVLAVALLLQSCSEKDEPTTPIFMQVAEISNGSSENEQITYDEYGRAVKYDIFYNDETISCTYSYPSENCILIHTKRIHHVWNDYDVVREYDDEMILDNGRASYCDGFFTEYEIRGDFELQTISKKYRQEFAYMADNHLNVIKNTEWNKSGDGWATDRPWTWENYYIWENDNLIEIEDYNGYSKPYYIFKYTYSSISGVPNIISIPYGRYSYFPLQLKGVFGKQSKNLIVGREITYADSRPNIYSFEYEIVDDRISSYIENRGDKSYNYKVTWIQ